MQLGRKAKEIVKEINSHNKRKICKNIKKLEQNLNVKSEGLKENVGRNLVNKWRRDPWGLPLDLSQKSSREEKYPGINSSRETGVNSGWSFPKT